MSLALSLFDCLLSLQICLSLSTFSSDKSALYWRQNLTLALHSLYLPHKADSNSVSPSRNEEEEEEGDLPSLAPSSSLPYKLHLLSDQGHLHAFFHPPSGHSKGEEGGRKEAGGVDGEAVEEGCEGQLTEEQRKMLGRVYLFLLNLPDREDDEEQG